MTKANSKLLDTKCSWANASKRLIASRNVTAVRTFSQVRVVRLAEIYHQYAARSGGMAHSNRAIDSLHSGVIGVLTGFTSMLSRCIYDCASEPLGSAAKAYQHTSSQVLASSKSQPISMTSAESLVTYTPCSSQVVATCITT